ncbi:TPA: tRNA lysidine(34) synthetase TilS [Candidatus Gracilibacteria bacterium]|nr:tRNA lysidine(34) synthetase TilS [Candidatus Gracilibacteria bacterium]
MLSQKFKETFSKTDTIIIAFSAGPDSVFLAEQLIQNGYKNIILAHFNHHMKVRQGENNTDEKFVQNYAEKNNITFEIGHWEKPENSENKARNARYLFLENMRKKYQKIHNSHTAIIVTGHHKNDVAETVLLQFFRSGGIKSLSGITEFDSNRNLFRPILHLFKSEILQFLHTKKILYCTDSSNSESIFTRNFMRNEIIPLLETRFPNIQEHLSVQAHQFKILENEIEIQANNFLENTTFFISDYLLLMNEVQADILRKILYKKAFSRLFFQTFLAFLHKTTKDNISGKKLETKYQIFTIRKGVLFIEEK